MSSAAKQPPPTSSRGRGSASAIRGRPSATSSARSTARSQSGPGSPKPNGSSSSSAKVGSASRSSPRAVNGKNQEPVRSAMSKSMIASASDKSRAGTAPKAKPRSGESTMTKSLHQEKAPGNCHVENGRQTSAEAKKAIPRPKPRTPSTKVTSVPKKAAEPAVVQHSDHEEEEEETEDIHPALLKQTRKSGSLNLSGRGLAAIPAKIWTLNEDESDGKKGLFMDKVDEDNWWDRVDLTKLILASNQISKVSPKIKNLTSLQILDLHDNNLSVLPEEIGSLENLTKLNLSHNKLTFLPMGFFNLKNLCSLNLCHNELNEIQEDISNLIMLEFFDVAHNKLMELPSGVGCLTKVNNFNASHNMLESIPYEITFLKSLACLELSHNNLQDLGESSMQDMHSLERLYLQHNKLKSMPTIKNCLHLKEIYLGFNQITELTDMDLETITNVKMLDLRDNKIPVLPDEIINLQGLERLDISNNDLGTLPFSLGVLPHLKSLQVDGNPMRGIRRDIIARGTQGLLKYLKSRIDDDELQRLRDKGQVSPVPSLSGSPPIIPDKFVMRSAQVMNLTGKDLTSLPKEAVENAIEADVTGVDLSKNHLSQVPDTLEPIIGKLFELNLSSNRLEKLPGPLMSLGQTLQYVNLSNNKLTALPAEMSSLSNLREICLNCNKFTGVPPEIYSCGKLETLMISDNRITGIDVDGLKKLTKLTILDMGNNNIGTVPPELGLLTNIRSLTLDGNAFRVPRPQILVKGTESIMAYLRDRIPRNHETDQPQQQA